MDKCLIALLLLLLFSHCRRRAWAPLRKYYGISARKRLHSIMAFLAPTTHSHTHTQHVLHICKCIMRMAENEADVRLAGRRVASLQFTWWRKVAKGGGRSGVHANVINIAIIAFTLIYQRRCRFCCCYSCCCLDSLLLSRTGALKKGEQKENLPWRKFTPGAQTAQPNAGAKYAAVEEGQQ